MSVPPQGTQPQSGGGLFTSLLPFILIIVVLYIFFFLPVQRKQKAHRAMLDALSKGDKVQTSGGIIGTIVSINTEQGTAVLKLIEGAKVTIKLSHISEKITEGEQ